MIYISMEQWGGEGQLQLGQNDLDILHNTCILGITDRSVSVATPRLFLITASL